MGLTALPCAGGDATWTQGGLFPNLPVYLIKMLHALLFGIDMEVQVPKDLGSLVVYDFGVILNNYNIKKTFQWISHINLYICRIS